MNLGSVGPIRRYSVWKLQPCSNPGEGLGYGLQFSVTLTNERNAGNCRPFELAERLTLGVLCTRTGAQACRVSVVAPAARFGTMTLGQCSIQS